jgi:hypothetical protein
MTDDIQLGQQVIYRCMDAYPPVLELPARVCKIAEPLTTGGIPVLIRLRNGRRLWVASVLLSAALADSRPEEER